MCILYLLMSDNIHPFLLYAYTSNGKNFIEGKTILRRMMELVYVNGHKNQMYLAFELIILK